MIETRRCTPCYGSGQLMGGGMLMKDCPHCDGRGKIALPDDEIEFLHMQTTDSYKDAIENIKKSNPEITDTEAKDIFKQELNKLNSKKSNNGRRKRER
jgi:hypothetical protein